MRIRTIRRREGGGEEEKDDRDCVGLTSFFNINCYLIDGREGGGAEDGAENREKEE